MSKHYIRLSTKDLYEALEKASPLNKLKDLDKRAPRNGMTVGTAVFKHIYNFYSQTNARIGYFRKPTDNQKEIDVVVEFPYSKSLIEVKFSEDTTLSENDEIVEMSKKEKNIASAILVTKNARRLWKN
ncbi:AAA family ATPase [Thermoanaerobacter kivui]|uniref:AAA family ATPase n=1 Tax=Thermoanaerobacter kivui TaxID=2325 RepID=A0A097AR40_THEKI|nr:DUF4143 domain-containing protein [Thermoanaerobacter kivui]AIS52285.1 AAA family ATPase [Thermoanaerobacter kivui]